MAKVAGQDIITLGARESSSKAIQQSLLASLSESIRLLNKLKKLGAIKEKSREDGILEMLERVKQLTKETEKEVSVGKSFNLKLIISMEIEEAIVDEPGVGLSGDCDSII